MSLTPDYPLASKEQYLNAVEVLRSWIKVQESDQQSFLAAWGKERFEDRYFLRLYGISKEAITIWLTFRPRTLHFESHFMPVPEENIEKTYLYLLKRNFELVSYKFSVNETGVYLIAHLGITEVSEASLDRLIGSAWSYTEAFFVPAMELGNSRFFKYNPKSTAKLWKIKRL